jgi:hypothetical protein
VFPRNAFDLAEQAVADAREGLDILAAIAASLVDPRVFSNLALDHRVLPFAVGKQSAGVPVLSAGGADLVIRAGEETLERLTVRLSLFSRIDPRHASQKPWLARTAHWYLQVLRETDPWKRFLWSFVGLEVLTHKLYAHFRTEVVERLRLNGGTAHQLPLAEFVWANDRAPLVTRFAMVATALFPNSAVEDVARFRKLTTARDDLSHASLRDEEALPVGEASELLGMYLTGALKKLVFGVDAEGDWDDPPPRTRPDRPRG